MTDTIDDVAAAEAGAGEPVLDQQGWPSSWWRRPAARASSWSARTGC